MAPATWKVLKVALSRLELQGSVGSHRLLGKLPVEMDCRTGRESRRATGRNSSGCLSAPVPTLGWDSPMAPRSSLAPGFPAGRSPRSWLITHPFWLPFLPCLPSVAHWCPLPNKLLGLKFSSLGQLLEDSKLRHLPFPVSVGHRTQRSAQHTVGVSPHRQGVGPVQE